jgi:hypothetical protein
VGDTCFHADKPFPFGDDFFLQQLVQKLQIRDIVFGGLFGVVIQHLGNPRPSERLEGVLQTLVQQRRHAFVTASSQNCS